MSDDHGTLLRRQRLHFASHLDQPPYVLAGIAPGIEILRKPREAFAPLFETDFTGHRRAEKSPPVLALRAGSSDGPDSFPSTGGAAVSSRALSVRRHRLERP